MRVEELKAQSAELRGGKTVVGCLFSASVEEKLCFLWWLKIQKNWGEAPYWLTGRDVLLFFNLFVMWLDDCLLTPKGRVSIIRNLFSIFSGQ